MAQLTTKRVVLFRDSDRSGELVEHLRDANIEALSIPLTELKPVEFNISFDDLLRFNWIVFTSQNSVRIFAEYMFAQGMKIPAGMKIAAVGEASANVIRSLFGIEPFVGTHADGRSLAAALCEKLDAHPNQEILWPSAEMVASSFQLVLELKGHSVERLIVYRTISRNQDEIHSDLDLSKPFHSMFFAAPSSVKALSALKVENIWEIPAVAIGQTTAEELRKASGKEPLVCASPLSVDIAEAIRRKIQGAELALND